VLGGGGSVRAVDKGPDAFRTISEVAEDLDLPQHVLRFWETRFGQIKPLKRGGGRRYYRPDDVELLKGIRHLLYGQGYTIRGVQRILKSDGVRFVQSIGRGELNVEPASEDPAEDDRFSPDETAERPDLDPQESIRAKTPDGAEAAPYQAAPEPQRRGAGLTADQRAALEAVLEDLLECRRVLATLNDQQAEGGPDDLG